MTEKGRFWLDVQNSLAREYRKYGRLRLTLVSRESFPGLYENEDEEGDEPSDQVDEPEVRVEEAGGMKTCPDCAEEVKAAARKCRFCGYRFDTSQSE